MKIRVKRNYKNLKDKISSYIWYLQIYTGNANSHISFWHETPEINTNINYSDPETGYYMTFYHKSLYTGPFDKDGVILLDYKGNIGVRYNPTAIAQYALGLYNRYIEEGKEEYLSRFLIQCDWLVDNLEKNKNGIYVWMYDFNWSSYKTILAPWYSGLAQGCGISTLVRAYIVTRKDKYLETAYKAFESFNKVLEEGGVIYIDESNNIWIEEEISVPPAHILNGFMWALWGVYDFYLLTKEKSARNLFLQATETLEGNLYKYDTGYWSLYGFYPTKLKMVASPFYHSLHIIQLQVMYKITKKKIFSYLAAKWERYKNNKFYQKRALAEKAIFKILYF